MIKYFKSDFNETLMNKGFEEDGVKSTGKKKPRWRRDFYYLDGLVSTGKRISLHNIKNNFTDLEKFSNKFYAQFFLGCGKALWCRFDQN